jgi:hypothetical protein
MRTVTSAQLEIVGATELRVGAAFARTLAILQRHLLPFCLVTAIAQLPNLVRGLDGVFHTSLPKLLTSGNGFLSIFLTAAAQAAVLYGTFQDMRGRDFSIGDTLRPGLGRIMPVLGVNICVGLAIILGILLFLVPGLMLASAFYVALPVCVVERPGVFASMGRSSRLTKGHRWRVFGIFLVTTLATMMVSAVIRGITLAPGGSLVGVAADFIWLTVAGAFNAVIAVVVYHDLRVIKEGIDVDQIAAVFD